MYFGWEVATDEKRGLHGPELIKKSLCMLSRASQRKDDFVEKIQI